VKGAAALRLERELGKGQMEGKSLPFHFKVLPRSVALLKSRSTRKNAVHNFTHDFHSRDTALFIALRYVGKPRRPRDRSTANQRQQLWANIVQRRGRTIHQQMYLQNDRQTIEWSSMYTQWQRRKRATRRTRSKYQQIHALLVKIHTDYTQWTIKNVTFYFWL